MMEIVEIVKDYEKLTKKELVKLCKDNNIIGISNKNKSKLLNMIKEFMENKVSRSNDKTQSKDEQVKISKDKSESNLEIIESKNQNKLWRSKCSWYKNGKSNECELYQKKILKQLLEYVPNKCNDRINMENVEIVRKSNPMTEVNGFEYTEDFDGKIVSNENTFYFNLKFCCDNGGAQTRTLRLVYDFIKYQIKYLKKMHQDMNKNNKSIYFVNILDGDTCSSNINKFMYLLEEKDATIIKKYIFIGDMFEFSKNKDFLELLIKQ